MTTRILFTITLLAVTSCKRDEQPPSATRGTVPEPQASLAPDEPRRMQPSKELSPLVQRLQSEQRNRPHDGVKAEQVFEALERAGVALTKVRQYLGATVQASYCAGGATADGIAVSVCEYPSAKAARAGLRRMQRQFAKLTPHARRVVHGHTLLTVAPPTHASNPAVVSRAIDTFTSL